MDEEITRLNGLLGRIQLQFTTAAFINRFKKIAADDVHIRHRRLIAVTKL